MKYRRKSTAPIDAVRWTGDNGDEVREFIEERGADLRRTVGGCLVWVEKSKAYCEIHPGDWVILEPDGYGVYPCAADIFEKTYEAVEP